MDPLVFLIVDNLRSAHRGLLCFESWDNGGLPGGPVGGHQARNTDRRARGNSARPSGQDPSARLINGFASQGGPASRAARPPPATPHACAAAQTSATARQRPQPAITRTRAGTFTRRDHPPDEMANYKRPLPQPREEISDSASPVGARRKADL